MKEKSKKIGLILLFGCFILSFVCLVASCTIKTKKGVKNSATAETCAVASCSQQLNAYIINTNDKITSTNLCPTRYYSSYDQDNWNPNSTNAVIISYLDLTDPTYLYRYIGISYKVRTLSSYTNYRLVLAPRNNTQNLAYLPYVILGRSDNNLTQFYKSFDTPLDNSYDWSMTTLYLWRGGSTFGNGVILDDLNIFTYDNSTTEYDYKKEYTPYGTFLSRDSIDYDLQYEKELSYYEGYNDGLELADNDLPSTIWAIFDAPFGVLYKVLNFDILGVNLWLVVTGIFTLVLVIWIVKKFKS